MPRRPLGFFLSSNLVLKRCRYVLDALATTTIMGLGCTSHAYNRWMRAANPNVKTNVARKIDGKPVRGVAGARLKEGADFFNNKRVVEDTIDVVAHCKKACLMDMAAGGPPV